MQTEPLHACVRQMVSTEHPLDHEPIGRVSLELQGKAQRKECDQIAGEICYPLRHIYGLGALGRLGQQLQEYIDLPYHSRLKGPHRTVVDGCTDDPALRTVRFLFYHREQAIHARYLQDRRVNMRLNQSVIIVNVWFVGFVSFGAWFMCRTPAGSLTMKGSGGV